MSPTDNPKPSPCAQCAEIVRHSARETEPHASLTLVSSKPWAQQLGKRAAGGLETYVCKTCGREMLRDTSPTYTARWM